MTLIKQAIAQTLYKKYHCTIYENDIPNGFSTPCFVIYTYDMDSSRLINNGFKNTIDFDVVYFSDEQSERVKWSLDKVQHELSHVHTVTDGVETFRLKDRKFSIVDDVLHWKFSVDYRELEIDTDSELLENLEVNSQVKEKESEV